MKFDGWEPIGEPLGEGGQGKVFKARSPERVKELQATLSRMAYEFRNANSETLQLEKLARSIVDFGGPDQLKDLGALKEFKMPPGKQERVKAEERLQAEIKALTDLASPGVLKLLHAPHASHSDRFIVTEFYPYGSLDKHLDRYRGDVVGALRAFRPLVQGVVAIHEKKAIHRDIKPQNIFVAADGSLVLGDFGIVFFSDQQNTRLTSTYERVGSPFWMAPWAYKNNRLTLEEVNPTLDIFPLAKVLWSIVAGREGFPFWEYTREENNLEAIFPKNAMISILSNIFSKTLVRDEQHCLPTAKELLGLVDSALEEALAAGEKPAGEKPWPCPICGKGHYVLDPRRFSMLVTKSDGAEGAHQLKVYCCDHCQHATFFRA